MHLLESFDFMEFYFGCLWRKEASFKIHQPVTILIIIHFCTSLLRVEKVKEIHGYSIRTESLFSATAPMVGNAILDAYSKCGNIEYASKIFQNLSRKRNLQV